MNLMKNVPKDRLSMVAVSRFGGEMLPSLPSSIPTFCYEKERSLMIRGRDRIANYLSKKTNPEKYAPAWLKKLARDFPSDLWYVNTIVQPDLARAGKQLGIRSVLHVHELELALQWVQREEDLLDMVNIPHLVLSCSMAAQQMMKHLGRKERMEVVYESIEIEPLINRPQRAMKLSRKKLGIPEDRYLWVSSGYVCSRKNPVLFIRIAEELLKQGYPVHFMWVGSFSTPYGYYAQRLAESLNISDRITWVGEKKGEEYWETIEAADGFLLTSNQESFSVVTLEAVCLGKPVVVSPCGGVTEIVEDFVGIVTKSWGLREMVSSMVKVMGGKYPRDEEKTAQHIKQFDSSVQADRWSKILLEYFKKE